MEKDKDLQNLLKAAGKADSLNAGLNYTRSELFIAIDADSLIEPGGLARLIRPYLESERRTVAVGGIVRVANNCDIEDGEVTKVRLPRSYLAATQVVEYLRAFLFGRSGWSRINSLPIISGAFGLFEVDVTLKVGGYRTDTVGEDMDLVVRIHRYMRGEEDYDISFVPDPVCWTQVPTSLKVLARQRNRWQRGLMESLFYNWKMIFNPRFGLIGLLGLPFFFLFEMLGPVVETTGYFVFTISLIMGWINIPFALTFLAVALIFGLLLSLGGLILEEYSLKRYEDPKDRVKMVFFAFLENFGYRQLHSFWRLWGIIDFFRKSESWGEMTRESFDSSKS